MEWLLIFGFVSFLTTFQLWYSIRTRPDETTLRPINDEIDRMHRWGNDRYGYRRG